MQLSQTYEHVRGGGGGDPGVAGEGADATHVPHVQATVFDHMIEKDLRICFCVKTEKQEVISLTQEVQEHDILDTLSGSLKTFFKSHYMK